MSKRSIVAASKEAEREIARQLGGRRLHAGEWSGMGGKGDVDVLGPDFAAQVKHRSGVPVYVTEGLKQIREAVQGPHTFTEEVLPLVIIRTKPGRGREAETLIMMDVATWQHFRGLDAGN
jgi:hypothetical protein